MSTEQESAISVLIDKQGRFERELRASGVSVGEKRLDCVGEDCDEPGDPEAEAEAMMEAVRPPEVELGDEVTDEVCSSSKIPSKMRSRLTWPSGIIVSLSLGNGTL